MENKTADIFERLRKGEIIAANDPEAYKMREASYATRKLLALTSGLAFNVLSARTSAD